MTGSRYWGLNVELKKKLETCRTGFLHWDDKLETGECSSGLNAKRYCYPTMSESNYLTLE